jgi:hypothetical protein
MNWRILVFYPEPEAIKFTNIRQSMLKLASMIYVDSDM